MTTLPDTRGRAARLRSAWYAPLALLLLAAAATAAAAVYLISSGEDPRSYRDTGYVTGQSDNFLSPDQAHTHLATYLATALWAEMAYETALEAPLLVTSALTAQPPLDCALPTGQPRTDQDILDCARAAVQANTPPPSWTTISPQARSQAAVTWLNRLWQATDPTEAMRITIIWREGVDPTDAPSIQSLTQEYAHCADRTAASRPALTNSATPQQLAAAWISTANAARDCANTVTNEVLPAKRVRTPTPTDPHQGGPP